MEAEIENFLLQRRAVVHQGRGAEVGLLEAPNVLVRFTERPWRCSLHVEKGLDEEARLVRPPEVDVSRDRLPLIGWLRPIQDVGLVSLALWSLQLEGSLLFRGLRITILGRLRQMQG